MQQDKALKILKANRQAIAEKYGVKKIGVFPYEETNSANCKCECGRCCGYHPQIGVAVEFKPDARPSLFDVGGLMMSVKDLFGCDVVVETVGLPEGPRYEQSDDYLQDVVYVQ